MAARYTTVFLSLCLLPLAGFYLFRALLTGGMFEAILQTLPYVNAVEASFLGLSTRNAGSVVAAGLAGCLWIISRQCYTVTSSFYEYSKRVTLVVAFVLGIPMALFLLASLYLGLRADVCFAAAVAGLVFCYRRLALVLPMSKAQGGGRTDR